MAYTEDDLNLLSTVPQLIGSSVASAAGSGLFGTGKELFANANAILDGLKSKGIDNAEKLRAQTLEDARAAAAILAAKATASEAEEYRQWALSIAEKVANAATEGGFLGFGGERITPAEKSLIDDIRKALGANAAV